MQAPFLPFPRTTQNVLPRFGVLRTLSFLHHSSSHSVLLTHTLLPVSTTVITTLSHTHTSKMAAAAAASRACRIRECTLTPTSIHMHRLKANARQATRPYCTSLPYILSYPMPFQWNRSKQRATPLTDITSVCDIQEKFRPAIYEFPKL